MKRTIIILISLLCVATVEVSAQKYKSAAGLRIDGGKMIGFNYTQRFFKKTTAELNFDFRQNEVKAMVMAKVHKPIIGRGLTLFGGLGVHTGNVKDVGGFSGGDISLGIEHKILIIPFVIGFELSPSVHFGGVHPDWYTFQSIFSVRYVLLKQRKGLFRRN